MAAQKHSFRAGVGVLIVLLAGESAWLAYPAVRDLIMPPRS